jgi:hypothetical protein
MSKRSRIPLNPALVVGGILTALLIVTAGGADARTRRHAAEGPR